MGGSQLDGERFVSQHGFPLGNPHANHPRGLKLPQFKGITHRAPTRNGYRNVSRSLPETGSQAIGRRKDQGLAILIGFAPDGIKGNLSGSGRIPKGKILQADCFKRNLPPFAAYLKRRAGSRHPEQVPTGYLYLGRVSQSEPGLNGFALDLQSDGDECFHTRLDAGNFTIGSRKKQTEFPSPRPSFLRGLKIVVKDSALLQADRN